MQRTVDDIFSRWLRPLTGISAATTVLAGLSFLGRLGSSVGSSDLLQDVAGPWVRMELLLGAVLVALGAALAMLWDLSPACRPKRLAQSFTGIHLILAALPAWQAVTLQSRLFPTRFGGSAWITVHGALALGFLLCARRIAGLEEPEPEILEREGVFRSWLQAPSVASREERRRLARDLHDSIKQQIFSVKMSAAAAEARWDDDPAGARTALADIRRSAQAAMVEMQSLLKQLRPESVLTEGLVEALREQSEALGYRSGAHVRFELGDLPSEEQLPPQIRQQLFRIAQEALSNIARHARALHVHVWLGTEVPGGTSLVLRVKDDGQGFDPAVEASGMGLRNIRERVESLQGRLVLESSQGNGTELRVYVALQTTDADRRSLETRRTSEPFVVPVLSVLYILFSVFWPSLARVTLMIIVLDMAFVRYRTFRAADARFVALSVCLMVYSWWLLLVWWKDESMQQAYIGGMIALPLGATLWVTWSFLRHLRHASSLSWGDWAGAVVLALLLVGSVASLLWGFIQGEMVLGPRLAVNGAVAFYGGWWLWNWKGRTAKP
jgi:signal transduction histidine kinase